jgi:hypothetical protein
VIHWVFDGASRSGARMPRFARVIPSLERESMAGNGGFFAGHCP